jgi:uncharacterized protein
MLAATIVVGALAVAAVTQLPGVLADAILHPARSTRTVATPAGCTDETFTGVDVQLRGWRCRGAETPRASLVLLHGVADSRASMAGVVDRFASKGFEVVAYDSRAHGASGGDFCTYGFWEKQDLRRVIDTLPRGPVILLGTSLGGAVALQEAATDPRVVAIVAAEVFSDLDAVIRDRAPRFTPGWLIASAYRVAEDRGKFEVQAASPARAARSIRVPVLLIHGRQDVDTPPRHSERIVAALQGPKRLMLVDGAHHNESLRGGDVWVAIELWIEKLLTP